ncbi:hypothetical protein JCM10908_000026 [Rhodotorula pacifica]|uniref:uncharacterized protein n=1 Tax=Rhodotorula pacifica TaxID=1495444 RepID=UPI00317957AD
MAPAEGDYSPLLATNRRDQAAPEHAFPPRERSSRRTQRRLPSQRPPLWLPDPFTFRIGGSTSQPDQAKERKGTVDYSDSDSGEDTVYGSDEEGNASSDEKRSGSSKEELATTTTDEEEDGWEFSLAALQKDRTRRRRRLLVLFPAFLILTLFFVLALANFFGPSSGQHRFYGAAASKRRMTLDEVLNGTFYPESKRVEWVAAPAGMENEGGAAEDGYYAERTQDGSITLSNLFDNSSRTLINGADVTAPDGSRLKWSRYQLSADGQYALFDTDWTKVWRHSTLANFYLHRIATSASSSSDSPRTHPILPPFSPPRTSLALFSPTSHHLAYVHANDLYILPAQEIDGEATRWEKEAIRITRDGSRTVMNGRPSWVYEEEVFSSDSTLWWSPTSSHLAFISFDESDVPAYEYPVYNQSPDEPAAEAEDEGWEYPKEVGVRYPKPGYPNPLITVRVFSLSRYLSLPASLAASERLASSILTLRLSHPFDPEAEGKVVTEVVWIGADELLVRMTDRSARVERIGRFDLASVQWEDKTGNAKEAEQVLVGEVVRETDWWEKDGGWAEAAQTIVSLSPPATTGEAPKPRDFPSGYLDLLPDAKGFVHVAIFSPSTASEPVFLTSGEWEVAGGIDKVDLERGLIYFTAARPSIARHVYSVPLLRSASELEALRSSSKKRPEPTLLPGQKVNDGEKAGTELAAYKVKFSTRGGAYQLDYDGPNIPWQNLYKVADPEVPFPLTDNAALASQDDAYLHASITHSREKITDAGAGTGDVEVNVMEIRPPMMDESGRTKYPVLFQVYGGPNSQIITTKFQRDFQHYLATSLDYVIVRVDSRGTGFNGRKFRSTVRGRLGEIERDDVTEVARRWAEKPYIDEKRVGVWGWSYGGFLTSKLIEANASVFSLGMAVAPVTDWHLYDSLYTERYMGLPEENAGGYRNSSVREMDGFRHADFALAHGSGDDNVHFQNSALLLDRFTMAGIRNFRFRMFTDSDHSIQTRNAYGELLRWLEGFLLERFGQGGRTKGRWKMRKDPNTARPAFGPGEHDFGEKA